MTTEPIRRDDSRPQHAAALEPAARFYKAGELIFIEGQPGDCLYLVQSGRVSILKDMAGSSEEMAVMEPGDFFGEMALLDDEPRSATARALTDAWVVVAGRADFVELMRSVPEVPIRMLRRLAGNLRKAEARIGELLGRREGRGASAEALPWELAAPHAELSLVGGETVWPLRLGRVRLGRRDNVTNVTPEVDLTDHDPGHTVSRLHARLELLDGHHLLIEEMGATNATLVNGQPMGRGTQAPLQDGDELQLGHVRLRLRLML